MLLLRCQIMRQYNKWNKLKYYKICTWTLVIRKKWSWEEGLSCLAHQLSMYSGINENMEIQIVGECRPNNWDILGIMSIGAVSIYPIGCRKLKELHQWTTSQYSNGTTVQCTVTVYSSSNTVQCCEVFVNDGSARLGLLEGVENWLF